MSVRSPLGYSFHSQYFFSYAPPPATPPAPATPSSSLPLLFFFPVLDFVTFRYARPIKLFFFFRTLVGFPVIGSSSSTEIMELPASEPTSELVSSIVRSSDPDVLVVVLSPSSFPGRCNPHHAKSFSNILMYVCVYAARVVFEKWKFWGKMQAKNHLEFSPTKREHTRAFKKKKKRKKE